MNICIFLSLLLNRETSDHLKERISLSVPAPTKHQFNTSFTPLSWLPFIFHTMQHVYSSVGTCPVFKALSYTWGRQIFHYIGCDGSSIKIQDSLRLALQRLRHETRKRVLWVDAICINQMDEDERNDQVLLMRKLFNQGEEIMIWLGEESHDSSMAFDLIRRVVIAVAVEQASNPLNVSKAFDGQDLLDAGLPEHAHPAWKALDSFFWRPWVLQCGSCKKSPWRSVSRSCVGPISVSGQILPQVRNTSPTIL